MAKRSTKKRITFLFYAPEANDVLLGGDFNDWDPEQHPMRRDKKGHWSKVVYLEPGEYEYLFLADGEAAGQEVFRAPGKGRPYVGASRRGERPRTAAATRTRTSRSGKALLRCTQIRRTV